MTGTWLDAKWSDVQVGTRIRRDNGQTGEVSGVDRTGGQFHMRVTIDTDGEGPLTLTVTETNPVAVLVAGGAS